MEIITWKDFTWWRKRFTVSIVVPRTQGKLVSSKPDLLLHLALLKSVIILPKLKPLTIASCCEIWSLLLLLEFATSKGCTCENQDGKSPVLGGILVVASRNWSPDQPLIYMLAWSNMDMLCLSNIQIWIPYVVCGINTFHFPKIVVVAVFCKASVFEIWDISDLIMLTAIFEILFKIFSWSPWLFQVFAPQNPGILIWNHAPVEEFVVSC